MIANNGKPPGDGTKPTRVCWNCDKPGHTAPECHQPKNEQHISKRQEEWKKAWKSTPKKGDAGEPKGKNKDKKKAPAKGKFAPPTPQEKGKRIIDGSPMYYHQKKACWFPDKQAAAAMTAAAAAAAAASAGVGVGGAGVPLPGVQPASAPAELGGDAAKKQARNLAFGNTAQMISASLMSLAQQFE
jgi:hypothetical protein